jgi:hypothetical protein
MKFICIGVLYVAALCGPRRVWTILACKSDSLLPSLSVTNSSACRYLMRSLSYAYAHINTYIHRHVNQDRNKYDSGTRKEVDDTSAKPIIAARERAHDGISIFFTKSFCGSCKQVFCKHLKNNVSMYVCMCGSLICDGHSHLRILLRDEELVLVDRFFVLRLHLQKSVLKSC